MVEAARAGDWLRLIELESGVARLRDALMTLPAETGAPVADLDRRRRLIERILDDDAEIRRQCPDQTACSRLKLIASTASTMVASAVGPSVHSVPSNPTETGIEP